MAVKTPLVTIGIPTRDRERFLPRALDAALGQTWPHLEVVVSDNASTDGTEALGRARAARDPRLRYVRQPRDLGFSGNLQACLDLARGDYFMWHADDDLAAPRFVERTVSYLEEHPEAVSCSTEYCFVDEDGQVTRAWDMSHLHPDRDWREAQLELFRWPEGRSVMATYGVHRTWAVRRVGAPRAHTFRCILSGTETPFLAELSTLGRIVVLPERLFSYTEHPRAKDSVAHAGSRLRRWELAMLHLTIPAKLTLLALAAPVPLRQRGRLVRACWAGVVRKGLRLATGRGGAQRGADA